MIVSLRLGQTKRIGTLKQHLDDSRYTNFRAAGRRLYWAAATIREKRPIRSVGKEKYDLRMVYNYLQWWPTWSAERRAQFTRFTGFSRKDLQDMLPVLHQRTKDAIAALKDARQRRSERDAESDEIARNAKTVNKYLQAFSGVPKYTRTNVGLSRASR